MSFNSICMQSFTKAKFSLPQESDYLKMIKLGIYVQFRADVHGQR